MHACVLSHFSYVQLFVTLWNLACQAPMSMEIFQSRILERVAVPSSRRSSQSSDMNLLCLLHCQVGSLPPISLGNPTHTHTHTQTHTQTHESILLQAIFLYSLLQNIDQHSLCYTVFKLSIVNIVVCTCQLQSLNLSLPLYLSHLVTVIFIL